MTKMAGRNRGGRGEVQLRDKPLTVDTERKGDGVRSGSNAEAGVVEIRSLERANQGIIRGPPPDTQGIENSASPFLLPVGRGIAFKGPPGAPLGISLQTADPPI